MSLGQYLIGLAIYALVGGTSYLVTKRFGLPNALPLVVLVFLVAPAIVTWLYVGGPFR